MNRDYNRSVSDADTDDLLSGIEPLENVTLSSFHSSPRGVSPPGEKGNGSSSRNYSPLDHYHQVLKDNNLKTFSGNVDRYTRNDTNDVYRTHSSMPATPYGMYKDISNETIKQYAASVDQKGSGYTHKHDHVSPTRANLLSKFEQSFKQDYKKDSDKNYSTRDQQETAIEALEPVDPDDPSPRRFAENILKSAYKSNMSAAELESLSIMKSPPRSQRKTSEITETETDSEPTTVRTAYHSERVDDVLDSARYDYSQKQSPKTHSRSLTVGYDNHDYRQAEDRERSPKSRHTRSATSAGEGSSYPDYLHNDRRAASDIEPLYSYGDREKENIFTKNFNNVADSHRQEPMGSEHYTQSKEIHRKFYESSYSKGDYAYDNKKTLVKEPTYESYRHDIGRDFGYDNKKTSQKEPSNESYRHDKGSYTYQSKSDGLQLNYDYRGSNVYNKSPGVQAAEDALKEMETTSDQRYRDSKNVSVSNSIEEMETVRSHLHNMLNATTQERQRLEQQTFTAHDRQRVQQQAYQSSSNQDRRKVEQQPYNMPSVSTIRIREDSLDTVSALLGSRLQGLPADVTPPSERGWGPGGEGQVNTSLGSKLDGTLFSENQSLREHLEKERTRRKHCEKNIQHLQGKLLETQQQLAVAVSTEKKKDVMIEQLDKTLAKVVEGWKKRETEREEIIQRAEEEKSELEDKHRKELSKVKDEITKLEDNIAREKQNIVQAEEDKDTQIQLHETERDRLSEMVETERERNRRIESERDRAVKGKEHVARQLDTLQKTLDQERNHWLESQRELKDLLDEARDSQHKIMQREKEKLDEQVQVNCDTQDALASAQKEIQRLQMEIDSVVREKDHIRVELGLMEARLENSKKKFETEVMVEMEKQSSKKLADAHDKMAALENELHESHRHTVQELNLKHMEEVRQLQMNSLAELQQKEASFIEQMQMYDGKLKEARTEITQLRLDKQKLEVQRNDITKRLQSMMQTHCSEALSLIMGAGKSKNQDAQPDISTVITSQSVAAIPPASIITSAHTLPYMPQSVTTEDTNAYVDSIHDQVQSSTDAHQQFTRQSQSLGASSLSQSTISVNNQLSNSNSRPRTMTNFTQSISRVPTVESQSYAAQDMSLDIRNSVTGLHQPQPAFSHFPVETKYSNVQSSENYSKIPDVRDSTNYTKTPAGSETQLFTGSHSYSNVPFSTSAQQYPAAAPSGSFVAGSRSQSSTYLPPFHPHIRVVSHGQQSKNTGYPEQDITFPTSNQHYAGGDTAQTKQYSSGFDQHLLPSQSASEADFNQSTGYGLYSARSGKDLETASVSTIDRKDDDDNVSVISSLLNEPSKNYGHISEKVQQHEERQSELQHYIKKLLEKSPGEPLDQVPQLDVTKVPTTNNYRGYDPGTFTPPIKQQAAPSTSANISYTIGETKPKAFTKAALPVSTSISTLPVSVNLSYSRAPVPTYHQSEASQPQQQQAVSQGQEPGVVMSPLQVAELSRLMKTYGSGQLNQPRVDDLMAYLHSIQAGQNVQSLISIPNGQITQHSSGSYRHLQLPAESSVEDNSSVRRNLANKYPAKSEGRKASKNSSPKGQKSSMLSSPRKTKSVTPPKHGTVSKSKSNTSIIKEKKPCSAAKGKANIWR